MSRGGDGSKGSKLDSKCCSGDPSVTFLRGKITYSFDTELSDLLEGFTVSTVDVFVPDSGPNRLGPGRKRSWTSTTVPRF